MNKQVFTFFTEELAKVAGVELNLRGYSEDPTSYYKDPKTVDRDIEKYEALLDKSTPGTRPRKSDYTRVSSTPRKGLLGKLGLKTTKTTVDNKKYDKAFYDYSAARDKARENLRLKGIIDPLDLDMEYPSKYRADQKHKDLTYGKLTSRMFDDSRELKGLDTDEAYSKNPYSNFLDDQKLDKIVEMYKGKMSKYDDPDSREGHKMFLDRAAALRKDPNVKGYRMEWG